MSRAALDSRLFVSRLWCGYARFPPESVEYHESLMKRNQQAKNFVE
jgi:hypothetical protein